MISLEKAPADFAQQVTKATNTQKNMLARDFATLDAAQRRIAREFSMEGKLYVFRQGDPTPRPSEGCDIEELAPALACSASLELATIAYRNPGFLFDPENSHYKEIFGIPDRPTVDEAWLLVRVFRASDQTLKQIQKDKTVGRRRQAATHGARYIQHRVMQDPQVKRLRGTPEIADQELNRIVENATRTHFEAVADYLVEHHGNEYWQVIFKNTAKVAEMEKQLSQVKAAQPCGVQGILFPS